MKVGATVRIVDHEGFDNILRVGEVGTVTRVEEQTIFVAFDGAKDPIDYPVETVSELSEDEQKQLKTGGNSGVPKAGTPTPPQLDKDDVDLDGEQKQLKQADSAESHATGSDGQTAGVKGDAVKLDGEQKDVKLTSGGTSSATRPDAGAGSQTAGVKGAQVELKGEQKTNQPVSGGTGSSAKGGKESAPAPAAPAIVESRIFRPVAISVLEQGDGEDQYTEIGEGVAIRNEKHLISAIRSAVHRAVEAMERPFDRVDIVFRRDSVAEGERRESEKQLLAALHMLDEGKGGAKELRSVSHAAAKAGVRTTRYESYTSDRYAKQILTEAQALVEQGVGGPVTIIWPPRELAKHVGEHLIVESIWGDRWVGTLQKGPARMFQIKTKSGTHTFSPNDVNRILRKPGAK